MLGRKEQDQLELFITGSLRQLISDEHALARVDRCSTCLSSGKKSPNAIASTMAGPGAIPRWRCVDPLACPPVLPMTAS